MHRPQRANHPERIQARHSATPLETPPRRAGIALVLNHQPAQSTNEAARAQKVAPWFRKIRIVVENGGSENRTRIPTSRANYGVLQFPLQAERLGTIRNDEAQLPNDEGIREKTKSKTGLATHHSSFGFHHPVAQRISARFDVFPGAFATNWANK